MGDGGERILTVSPLGSPLTVVLDVPSYSCATTRFDVKYKQKERALLNPALPYLPVINYPYGQISSP